MIHTSLGIAGWLMISLSASAAPARLDPPAEAPVAATESAPEPPRLTIGDAAPPLDVEAWVRVPEGQMPVGAYEPGQIYVIEFFATWCGPCLRSFPNLSRLQSRYKDQGVHIVGVNVLERAYDEQTLARIEAYTEKHADLMKYPAAYDGPSRAMDRAFMRAAGLTSLPAAFIIDRAGKIAYIGHPGGMEQALDQVVKGTLNLERAKAKHEAESARERRDELMRDLGQRFNEAIRFKDYPRAWSLGRELVEGPASRNYMVLALIAGTIVDAQKVPDAKDRDLDLATKAATQALELTRGAVPEILWTLARIEFLRGNKAGAIDFQTRALEVAVPSQKARLEAALKIYQELP
jgi:thiol-disulfide isomerase/thioredoxin